MKRKRITAIFCIGAITMLCFLCLRLWKIEKAKTVAEAYLASKYSAEMVYKRTRLSIVDPMLYHVMFSSKEDGVDFEVIVIPTGFSLPENPDNYIIQVFRKSVLDEFSEEIEKQWGETANLTFNSRDPLYTFQDTQGLSPNASLASLSQKIRYALYVNTQLPLENLDKMHEANKIYDLFQSFEKKGLFVPELNMVYKGKTTNIFLEFSDVSSYKTVEKVLNRLNEN